MQDIFALLVEAGKDLTSFFSIIYLFAFLPACIFFYIIAPQKLKKYVLLIESFVFFWLISGKLIFYLILSAIVMYCFGIWLDNIQSKQRIALKDTPREERKAVKKQYDLKQNTVIALSVFLLIGILGTLKYSSFFATNINTLLSALKINLQLSIPGYMAPIGISFFSLQALSYIFDVRRGIIKADKNPVRLMLFLSFFPQIVEGPIGRYQQTAMRLWNVSQIKYDNLTLGLQRIVFGMVKKLVIADRLNAFVVNVFDNYADYEGGIIAIGAVAYTVQLYMDFSGSMDAVIGTAEIFGIELPENFRQPFFSKSISEFWQRWHITLGAWFKDYVFLPITGSRKMKKITTSASKKIGKHFGPLLAGGVGLLCVWICNGLWHGSAWNYIFFGIYHFVLILSGNIIEPYTRKICNKLKIDQHNSAYRGVQMLRTGALVVIGELFFRANGLKNGLQMFVNMVMDFKFTNIDENLIKQLGMDKYDCIIIAVTLLIIFVVGVLKERGINIRKQIDKRNFVIRWGFTYSMLFYIIIFGAYGMGYVPVDPLYAQF